MALVREVMAMWKRMPAERGAAANTQRQLARAGLDEVSVAELLNETLAVDWHAATLKSVVLGTLGVLHAGLLCIHGIGRASAWARDRDPKRTVKQIDRLLSNRDVTVFDRDGSVLLTASSSRFQGSHTILRLATSGVPRVTGVVSGPRALALAPIADRSGYTLIGPKRAGGNAAEVRRLDDLAMNAGAWANLGGCL